MSIGRAQRGENTNENMSDGHVLPIQQCVKIEQDLGRWCYWPKSDDSNDNSRSTWWCIWPCFHIFGQNCFTIRLRDSTRAHEHWIVGLDFRWHSQKRSWAFASNEGDTDCSQMSGLGERKFYPTIAAQTWKSLQGHPSETFTYTYYTPLLKDIEKIDWPFQSCSNSQGITTHRDRIIEKSIAPWGQVHYRKSDELG